MADRPCDVSGCSGQLFTRDDRLFQCGKCGVIYNPRPYPVRRDPNYTKADLLGPENYPSLCQ